MARRKSEIKSTGDPSDAREPVSDPGESNDTLRESDGNQRSTPNDSGSGTGSVIDGEPVTINTDGSYDKWDGAGSDGTEPRKRRGRKPGTKNKPKETSDNLAGIESILFSIHAMGAAITHTPELALSMEEAHLIADAAQKVAENYPLVVDPKTVAWINLAMVLGTVYGTRIIAIGARHKEERKKRPIPISGNPVGQAAQQQPKPNGTAAAGVVPSMFSFEAPGD